MADPVFCNKPNEHDRAAVVQTQREHLSINIRASVNKENRKVITSKWESLPKQQHGEATVRQ